MKLSREQTDTIIKNGQARGLTGKAVLDSLIKKGYEPEGIDINAARQALTPKVTPVEETTTEEPGAFQRIKDNIVNKGKKVEEVITAPQDPNLSPELDAVKKGVEATATGFSAISSTIYSALPDEARNALDKIGGGIGKGMTYLTDKISNSKFLQDATVNGDSKNLEAALKIASDLGLISGEILLADQAANAGKLADKGITKVIDKTTGAKATEAAQGIIKNHVDTRSKYLQDPDGMRIIDSQGGMPKFIESIRNDIVKQLDDGGLNSLSQKLNKLDVSKFKTIDELNTAMTELASKEFGAVNAIKNVKEMIANKDFTAYPKEIAERISHSDFVTKLDPHTKNVIESSSIEKFNGVVKSGETALKDPRVPTPIEQVGERVNNQVLPVIKEDLSRIGAQKSASLNSVGSSKAPGIAKDAVEYLRGKTQSMKLTPAERSLVDDVVAELDKLGKNPTIGSADKTVDLLQAMFYEKAKGMAIPTTSRVKSLVNQTIGKLNNSVKDAAKKSLGSNEYSVLNDAYSKKINLFNKLNKAIGEGDAKGGSFINKFYSKSGSLSTKKLLQEIKEMYGMDLAEDATLAKFVMDSLGDTRSLGLGDVPVTKLGAAGKAMKFLEDKIKDPIGKARKTIQKRGSIPKK